MTLRTNGATVRTVPLTLTVTSATNEISTRWMLDYIGADSDEGNRYLPQDLTSTSAPCRRHNTSAREAGGPITPRR